MLKKIFLFLFISGFFLSISFAQNLTQTLKGTVVDKDSKAPLAGANIVIINSDPLLGTSTDQFGRFRFENIPIGRHSLKITFLGYEEKLISEISVGTGKEIVLNIELQESVLSSDEVVITAKRSDQSAINTMATVSAKTFSTEETQRYAGGFNDLSRMTESFAGVASFTGETNEIVIRGNSPRGLLWRVEGIEVSNPNHFPRGNGSSGGGISIITSDVISNSDFFTGAFPAEYGNALSGVFDINLRNGNPDKVECALQLGVIGVEATLEGPIIKKSQSSYLLNYRYSTLKLFDLAGIKLVDNSVIPEFQDITFKINLPTKKAGTFSLFGLGGLSSAGEKAEKDSLHWEYSRDRFDEYELHKMGAIGLKHFYSFRNRKTYLKNILSVDAEENTFNSDSMDNNYSKIRVFEEDFSYTNVRGSFQLNHKAGKRQTIRAGLIGQLKGFNMLQQTLNNESGQFDTQLKNKGNTFLIQSYLQWKYRLGKKIDLNAGVHFVYFGLNSKSSIEPRAGLKWKISGNQALSLGFGLHSRVEAISFYFIERTDNSGIVYHPNSDIGLTKSYHNILGYEISITEKLHLKVEGYFQYLFDVPIEDDASSYFSTLNYRGGISEYILTNDGTGYNYGVEVTFEKYFSKNYYYLATISLYESKYKAPDGNTYNTFYNNNYIFNLVGGKEFKLGKNKNCILGTNVKFLWKGGNRMIPIDLEKSQQLGTTVYNTNDIYESRSPDFIRFDLGVSFKRNRPKWSWMLSVDVQNVLNRDNVFTYRYNSDFQEIEPILALPIIPVINLRIEI